MGLQKFKQSAEDELRFLVVSLGKLLYSLPDSSRTTNLIFNDGLLTELVYISLILTHYYDDIMLLPH